jgi:hypothetical protein
VGYQSKVLPVMQVLTDLQVVRFVEVLWNIVTQNPHKILFANETNKLDEMGAVDTPR